jgi:hypothetical protein
MQNSGGTLTIEASEITDSDESGPAWLGVHLEGGSSTSIVGSNIHARGEGIRTAGPAACHMQSSLVSNCDGQGIEVCGTGQDAANHINQPQLRLYSTNVTRNRRNGVLVSGAGATAHVGARSVIEGNGEAGVMALRSSEVVVQAAEVSGNACAAIVALDSQLTVMDADLTQNTQQNGAGRSHIVVGRCGPLSSGSAAPVANLSGQWCVRLSM